MIAHFHAQNRSSLRQKQLFSMVLAGAFQDIFIKTQISRVK